jgi:hypothetical protein
MYPAGSILTLGYVGLSLIVLLRKRAFRLVPVMALSVVVVGLFSLNYVWAGSMFFHVNEMHKCVWNVGCMGKSLASHFNPRSYFADSYTPPDFTAKTHMRVSIGNMATARSWTFSRRTTSNIMPSLSPKPLPLTRTVHPFLRSTGPIHQGANPIYLPRE